jgi:hypothetical protein
MLESECNHFEIVNESLSGDGPIDEDTFSSIAVLAERLERLKKTDVLFDKVGFSEQVEELALHDMISAIS